MEKNEFLKLTAKIFQDYGFLKFGNQFFLNLDRVVVKVYRFGARFSPGEYCYYYNLCFKDIHEDYKFETKDDYKKMPEDLGVLNYIKTREILVAPNGTPYKKWAFYPTEYTEESWTKLWSEALHKEFDPFKTDFENYVKNEFPLEKVKGITIQAKKEFVKRGIIFKD